MGVRDSQSHSAVVQAHHLACRHQEQALQQREEATGQVQQMAARMSWPRCLLMVASGSPAASTTASLTTRKQACSASLPHLLQYHCLLLMASPDCPAKDL